MKNCYIFKKDVIHIDGENRSLIKTGSTFHKIATGSYQGNIGNIGLSILILTKHQMFSYEKDNLVEEQELISGITDDEHNPQAFPVMNPNYDGNWNKEAHNLGMTLRDYFAAKVMQSMVSSETFFNISSDDLVIESYKIADLMLKERVKK